MNEDENKKHITGAIESVQLAVENLQNILGGENLYLGELVLQTIKVLAEEERKLKMLRDFMNPETKHN